MKKLTIIGLFAVFLLPAILALLLHSQWLDWTPESSRAHGELIEPVVPLPRFSADSSFGPVASDDLEGNWQLVHVTPGACREACLEALYWLRQVRRAQDRHQPDISLLLVTGVPLEPEWSEQIRQLSDHYRVVDGDQGNTLVGVFPGPTGEPSSYIMDPETNIIMRYPVEADPTGIRRDLRRLLTWTHRD